MKLVYLSCNEDFVCLAGACPDTCCRDWEIALDEPALEFYRSAPGALGEEVRAQITDDDGPCFQLKGGYCPLLDEQGLCRIQKAWGAEALTQNCDYFPRFYEIYGGTTELSLSLACPEAARRLLQDKSLQLITKDDGKPVTEINTLDPDLYIGLRLLRSQMFAFLKGKDDFFTRMAKLDALAKKAQGEINRGSYSVLRNLREPRRLPWIRVEPKKLVDFFAGLSILRPDWVDLLNRQPEREADVNAAERMLYYHVFRYALKAVVDDRLYPRIHAGVLAAQLVLQLTACGVDPVDALYRYSREVEHDPENFEKLLNCPL